ncbi:His-Xaa-Ser system protein HxsD [Paludisphaera soli]|uniref:His-Xaa-Ser system protein HxsD n=1 Tax=Paludisphaera soli TaxID=2712865 RepID=UPI0013E99F84|nr:His-Xaa-Ser system protein HxsD [Paludisphaera soli]
MPEIMIHLDTKVYSLSAVKKTAYRIGDRATARIEIAADGGAAVRLTIKDEKTRPEDLEAEFLQELLDQDLRESISRETEKVRNLLLAHAFSGLSAVDDAADHREDPLGIGRSQAMGR